MRGPTPILENQREQNIENEMETRVLWAIKGSLPQTLNPKPARQTSKVRGF